MPGVSIQLCCWHAKRAWLRNLLEKVKDGDKRQTMFKALDKLMRLNVACPTSWSADQLKELCQNELEKFYNNFSDEPAFVEYFKREWATKMGALVCGVLRLHGNRVSCMPIECASHV
jgi:hypothetical protein